MVHQEENAALLALRGGLRGRFRRSFDCMENAFEVLQDRLDHTATPAERAELTPLLEELQTQLLCLRRLGDQASDAATAALLHGTCEPRPIDLLGQLREICEILREEAAQYALPFTIELQAAGLDVLPTLGDASLLNGLLTNLVSNTLAVDRAAAITLVCAPGQFCYRDNGPGLPPDAKSAADRRTVERPSAPRGRAGPAADCRLCPDHGLGSGRGGGAWHGTLLHPARCAAAGRPDAGIPDGAPSRAADPAAGAAKRTENYSRPVESACRMRPGRVCPAPTTQQSFRPSSLGGLFFSSTALLYPGFIVKCTTKRMVYYACTAG